MEVNGCKHNDKWQQAIEKALAGDDEAMTPLALAYAREPEARDLHREVRQLMRPARRGAAITPPASLLPPLF